MSIWQFFLQEKGKRELIPVTTSIFTLTPGCYRVMVESNLIDTSVEISLRYQESQVNTESNFTDKYLRLTDSEGKLTVTPFLDLSPSSILTIRCQSDIFGEFMGKSWQQNLQLNILSDSTLQDVDSNQFNLNLNLERQVLIRELQNFISLSGKITSELEDNITKGKITYSLNNPKTGETLLSHQEMLLNLNLPFDFNYDIEINPEWDTCLILGTISLEAWKEKSTFEQTLNFTILDSLPLLYQRLQQVEQSFEPSPHAQIDLLDLKQLPANKLTLSSSDSNNVLPPKLKLSSSSHLDFSKMGVDQALLRLDLRKKFTARLNNLAHSEQGPPE